jgi:predicted DNA-binding protein (MmcQ/YjbR family)
MAADLATLRARLRTFALSLPGAYEEFPWGERVAKVAKKVFVFLGKDGDASEAGLSVKLPASRDMALSLPFATPTEYGLGKSGWVTARFTSADAPPLDLLTSWIDESYRAVAPKTLVAQLTGGAPLPSKTGTARKKAAATRTPLPKTRAKEASAKKKSVKKTKTSATKTSATKHAGAPKAASTKGPARRKR